MEHKHIFIETNWEKLKNIPYEEYIKSESNRKKPEICKICKIIKY